MARMVECVKLNRLLPGLDAPPFPGELGERIYNEVSAQAYDMWQEYSTLIINHNGLSLGNPQHRDFLMEQMEEYLFGGAREEMPEDWTPMGQATKGGATKGGATKGGAAPRK